MQNESVNCRNSGCKKCGDLPGAAGENLRGGVGAHESGPIALRATPLADDALAEQNGSDEHGRHERNAARDDGDSRCDGFADDEARSAQ